MLYKLFFGISYNRITCTVIMKLTCSVEIVNKQVLAGSAITSRGKAQQSVLSIGKQSVKNNELFLLLQTRKNSLGTKYKIKNNIENVFAKFINDGKMTIRLKEPTIDLNIKCSNSLELKSFYHVLKMGVDEKLSSSIMPISNLNPKKMAAPVKKKIVVKSKTDYPVLEGFPRTTEELFINGLERKSFDRQILRLQSLRLLDLSNNSITHLPKELGTLPHLRTLNLGENLLGLAPNRNAWSWLEGNCIRKNLQVLDLHSNQLKCLPKQLGKLSSLVSLMVEKNKLTELPVNIGVLSSLTNFNVADNILGILPGSLLNLRLETFNISNNIPQLPRTSINQSFSIPKLKELAARAVVNNRFYCDASMIPLTLVEYLDDAQFCTCGNSCFGVYITKYIQIMPRSIAKTVISQVGSYNLTFYCTFCSIKCADSVVHA